MRRTWGYVTVMVTHIHKNARPRLFLKEHRKAKEMSPEIMAGRLGIERESVHRWEREWWRVSPPKQQQYADALGIDPAELWRPPRPPERPSIDQMLQDAPDELVMRAAEIAAILLKTG